jgi:hypothetical protein
VTARVQIQTLVAATARTPGLAPCADRFQNNSGSSQGHATPSAPQSTVDGGMPHRVPPSSNREQIMDDRHSRLSVRSRSTTRMQFRIAALATIAIAGAATMLSGQESRAGAPPASYAVCDDSKDLDILRIENSTYPTPPSGSETSPWSGQR